ncbi:hypothetical protein SLS58_006915 [Diplodia intermedia]|uniref:DUF7730 domain-containing protein n=1 Tax=Diplodia intermedia TaxID=856260 RepID=A0ABR3TLX8_9PEZI
MDQPGNDTMAAPSSDSESASEAVAAPGPFLRQDEVTTAHPHPRTRSTHFPFLSLPAEVRVMIYGYLLVLPDEGNIHIVPKDEGSMFGSPSAHRDSNVFRNQTLNILLVSKLIYAEAVKEFYSENTFNFGRSHYCKLCPGEFEPNDNERIATCQTFLTGRSPNMLANIKSIEIGISMPWPPRHRLNADFLRPVINTLNCDLPVLGHLTLNFHGFCPGVLHTPWRWPSSPQRWLGVLLELRKISNLHIYYSCDRTVISELRYGDPPSPHKNHLGRMVAFASFLRAHLLKNADDLGNRNIQAHLRHWSSFTLGRWKRKMERVYVVECHDDENGNSFLRPAVRLEPRQIGFLEKRAKDGDDRAVLGDILREEVFLEEKWRRLTTTRWDWSDEDEEIGASDAEDWDLSDDGDNDSLNGEDLSGVETTFTRDEHYLKTYAQLRSRP